MFLLITDIHQGPCSVSIDSSLQSFHHYKGGIYREEECSNKTHNHAVLVVGYGVDENSGSAYWLVKNSWAETWGEKGYMRLARNENNMCCIACHASYPLVWIWIRRSLVACHVFFRKVSHSPSDRVTYGAVLILSWSDQTLSGKPKMEDQIGLKYLIWALFENPLLKVFAILTGTGVQPWKRHFYCCEYPVTDSTRWFDVLHLWILKIFIKQVP